MLSKTSEVRDFVMKREDAEEKRERELAESFILSLPWVWFRKFPPVLWARHCADYFFYQVTLWIPCDKLQVTVSK